MKLIAHLTTVTAGWLLLSSSVYAGNNCPEVKLEKIQELSCANGLSSFQGDMKYTSDKITGNTCEFLLKEL